MSGVTSPWIVGVKLLQLSERGLELARERELHRVEELAGRLAHHDDELRLDDVELAREEGARLVLVAARRT